MTKSFLSLVAVAVAASTSLANGCPDQAPPVNAVQMRAVRTQTVLVRECLTDAFGKVVSCRMVPRTETVYEPADPPKAAVIVPLQAPPVKAADCLCVKATGSCPCAGVGAAVAASASYALPAVHAVRGWFKDRPKLFHGPVAKRLRGESNCE